MWARLTAGIVLGAPLSIFLLGALTYLMPGPWQNATISIMFLFPPLWLSMITISAIARTALRAWGLFALSSILAFALLRLSYLLQ